MHCACGSNRVLLIIAAFCCVTRCVGKSIILHSDIILNIFISPYNVSNIHQYSNTQKRNLIELIIIIIVVIIVLIITIFTIFTQKDKLESNRFFLCATRVMHKI